MDNRVGYSFSLQDIVALTVKSFLCMIAAFSAHGELHFSFHPFFPPNVECGGSFGEIHSCGPVVHNCREGSDQFHVGDFPGFAVCFN